MSRVEATTGLRERKKAEARAALVEAALRLFAERGFDAVTVDAIAEEAGVSRRSFFRYFPTKEAVVLDRRREQLGRLEALLEAAPLASSPERVVRDAFAELAADYARRRARVLAERVLFASAPSLALHDLELDRAFEAAIERAVARRLDGPSAARRARLYAAAAIAVVRVLIDGWAARSGRSDLLATGLPALAALSGLLDAAPRQAATPGGP